MNTHNDFLDNAVNDELEMECIGDLTTDVCSDMQSDTEKICLSLQNATCGERMSTISEGYVKIFDSRMVKTSQWFLIWCVETHQRRVNNSSICCNCPMEQTRIK